MNKSFHRLIPAIFALVGLLVLSCGLNTGSNSDSDLLVANPAYFDTTCAPCQDFYQFANGAWLEATTIPPERSRWGMIDAVQERNYELLRKLLEDAASATEAAKGSAEQIAGDFYYAAMDTARIEAAGADPLQADFDRIDALASIEDFQSLIADYHAEGYTFLFSYAVEQDLVDNRKHSFYVMQGRLGLPDRDYYTRDDQESVELRTKYVRHVAAMLSLLGDSEEEASVAANRIMAIETRLAEASLTRVELRVPANWHNLVTIEQANAQTPNFAWDKYLAGLGRPDIKQISSTPPKFFDTMNKLLDEVPLEDWKDYLRWHLARTMAPALSSDFVNTSHDFYSKTMVGTEEIRPRWKRVLGFINRGIGESLGQLYVGHAFAPDDKAGAVAMVDNLIEALEDRIKNLDWMGDQTKNRALEKLGTLTVKVGYPDKWRDYSSLDISRDSYVANRRAASAFETRRMLDRIGKLPDRTEWVLAPQVLNAYYNPLFNEIVFTAAILQPPLFDANFDDAINYGAIGALIGHELTHGYDDMGRQFDASGNMTEWWSPEDVESFNASTAKFVEQYSEYVVVDSLHINGELTLGENIADLGGLLIAYDALQNLLDKKGSSQVVDGYTPQQRFFLAWAQSWQNKARPEYEKLQVNTSPHPPYKFRVIGPLSNMEAFHEAFKCAQGDAMVRPVESRPSVW